MPFNAFHVREKKRERKRERERERERIDGKKTRAVEFVALVVCMRCM